MIYRDNFIIFRLKGINNNCTFIRLVLILSNLEYDAMYESSYFEDRI